jgi:hypothetical protein
MIMAHRKTWETSVNEAVRIFREGLLALIPVVEKAKMPWADPHAYDDWDVIAQGLYEGIVILLLAHSTQWHDFEEIPKFDHRISDYHDRSYIFLTEVGEQKPFICFHSVKAPFDTALVASLDKRATSLMFPSTSWEIQPSCSQDTGLVAAQTSKILRSYFRDVTGTLPDGDETSSRQPEQRSSAMR